MKKSKVLSNTIMLYIMSIAKLIFPLLTLPYLTRILSEESYGFVSYVKSCMTYMQIIIDFGFILSSVKDIVKANGDKEEIGKIAGNTFLAKMLLSALAGLVLLVMFFTIDILSINGLYVLIAFLAVACTSFLADFLFRGIEKMHYITAIYLVAKGVSVALTFILVKDDSDLLLVPILDMVTNVISVLISMPIVHKQGISIRFSGIKDSLKMIKNSFVYFLSTASATAFSALNTFLIGIFIKDLEQIAHWSLCLNIITAIQGLYAPICNGIYPHMIKQKSLKFIHKVLALLMPVVIIGCATCFIFAKTALGIIGGEKYVDAYELFRWLIPVLLFSFPAQVYGWPTLGASGMAKQTTTTTVIASIVQVLGLAVLALVGRFELINLAILRFSTEAILLITRLYIVYKNKAKFNLNLNATDNLEAV